MRNRGTLPYPTRSRIWLPVPSCRILRLAGERGKGVIESWEGPNEASKLVIDSGDDRRGAGRGRRRASAPKRPGNPSKDRYGHHAARQGRQYYAAVQWLANLARRPRDSG